MMSSWHNFFYISYDPGGFVSVDKPPIALWIQVACAKIFGIHSWSLMLPEALAAVGSVAVLYHLTKRIFGYLAGIIASFALAITPIFIAVSRSNNPDAILVFLLVLAAWQLIEAANKGNLKHLILAAVLIGLGFNTKMLVAFLVVPSFLLVYLFASYIKLLKKCIHLVIFGMVLLAVSFSWVIAVDLTPVSQRPYVGSSSTNSEMNLVFGYNGFSRVTQYNFTSENGLNAGNHAAESSSSMKSPGSMGNFKLFNIYFGQQINWFAALAAFGVLSALFYCKSLSGEEKNQKLRYLLLWGSWVFIMYLFFSVYQNMTHRYYTAVLAPGLASLVGIGISCFRKMRRHPFMALAFPVTLIISAGYQLFIVSVYHSLARVLTPILIAGIFFAVILIGIAFFKKKNLGAKKCSRILSICCLAILFLAPAYWSFTTVIGRVPQADPYAGPGLLTKALPDFQSIVKKLSLNTSDLKIPDYYKQTANYLEAYQESAEYLAAVPSASLMSEYLILLTGKPVMNIGGYSGTNAILTLDQFKQKVSSGKLKYFITDSHADSSVNTDIINWVVENGKKVNTNITDKTKTSSNYSIYDISVIYS
ncbi:MAG TPA: glycosyltransferase family 39 protein [Clostridia bacterium]|nr:glycosyltransferase family 39 protein [Clostridia bacterium]